MPQEVIDAERLAETRAYNRSMLINAYQLCLNSAHSTKRLRATPLGAPVQSRHLVSLTDFSNPISLVYPSSNDPYCIYVNSSVAALARRQGTDVPSRNLIEADVIAYSFQLLGKVMTSQNRDALKLAELLFWAHSQYGENFFANALILSWAACEKMIAYLWSQFLRSKKGARGDRERISASRLKKLEGRDFSASVVTEILELSDVIAFDLFSGLDEARRKRNSWLHSLEAVTDRDASNALRTATALYHVATHIELRPAVSRTVPGTGGVPPHLYEFPDTA